MAIIECKECKHQVSSKAKTCPNCGATVANNIGCLGYVLIIFGALFVFSLLGKSSNEKPTTSAPPQQQETIAKAVTPIENTWIYEEQQDKIAKGIIKSASILSNNKVELDFPYAGGTTGRITVRKHPRWGTDAIITISKGQLLCTYSDCKVTVKFDDLPGKTYKATEPSDHSNETVFINDAKGFIKKLKSAKKTYVEVAFYQNGTYTFEFNTENLKFE